MSIADRLFQTRASVDVANPKDPILAEWFGGRSNTSAGMSVTPDRSLQLISVYAAVSIIADTIAALPLSVYRRTESGKEPAPKHPVTALLQRQPNDWQTSFEFREMMQGHVLLRGNAYAEIVGTRNNPVSQLIPLHPDRVQPFIAPDGKIAYAYQPESGDRRILLQHEVFHLRGLSSDGVMGLSPIELAKNSVALGMAAEEFGARFFGNGTTIGGVLQHPQTLSDEAYDRLKKSWQERHQGPQNANKPAILEEGMEWKSMGVPPEQAQFLETRKFQVSEIARLFRVPPHLIGDVERSTSWGTGIEQQNIGFVQFSLMPWMVRWEQAGNKDLLSSEGRRTFFLKHKVEGLLRGDSAARGEFYTKMFNIGAFSTNVILELEDMNPVEGGDQRFVPLNMVPLNQASDGQAQNDGRSEKLLENEIRRTARKEVRAVERALKSKKDDFEDWARDFYDEHVGYVAEVMALDHDVARAYTDETVEELIRCVTEGDAEALDRWSENRTDRLRHYAA